MLRAVIFDIDGTLINSVDAHAQAWVDAFREFGKDFPFDRVREQIGKGGDQLLPVFLSKEEIDAFGKKIEDWRGEHMKANFLPHFKPFPRVRELFERILADGKKVSVATSAKPEEMKVYTKLAGIDDLLEDEESASSGDAEKSKPHPDIFQAALAKLAIDPHEAIVIGDTPYDAEAAGKAGIKSIGVLCGGFPEESLRGAGCVAVYRDAGDLLAHYDESPLAK